MGDGNTPPLSAAKKNKRARFFNQFQLHLLVLPCVALVIVFCYVPMFGLLMAFQNFRASRGIFGSAFVGLQNFRNLFMSPDVMQVIYNTIIFAVSKIVLLLVIPLTFALLLNEVRHMKYKRFVQTVTYLPHFLSWVILASILKDMLDPSGGIINQALERLFGAQPIFFLGSNRWFRGTVIFTAVWKEFGFSSIVLIAAITGINPELYESAVVDGADRWKRMWHITLPGILPILVVVFILNLTNILNGDFNQIFNLYNPLVYKTGDIIDTFVYRVGLIDLNYSFATAVGLFKSVVSMAVIVIGYGIAYRFANYRIF